MSIFGATDTPVSGEAAPNVDYIEKCLFNNHLTWYCRVWLTLSNIKRTHYE